MIDPGLLGFVLDSLPRAPARVLEVGAGDGELAEALGGAGYRVVAIDPASNARNVRAVPLHELSEPPGSFDAAVGVLSMHHVEPLRGPHLYRRDLSPAVLEVEERLIAAGRLPETGIRILGTRK